MNHKVKIILQYVIIIIGYTELLQTDAFYSPYIVCLVAAVTALTVNVILRLTLSNCEKGIRTVTVLWALAFTLMITLPNHIIWTVSSGEGIFRILLAFSKGIILAASAFVGFYNVFKLIACKKDSFFLHAQDGEEPRPMLFFALTFAAISVIDIAVLFLAKYPGLLSYDSVEQLNQVFSGEYSNHHPVVHTLLIKAFISLGMALFNDIYAALATFFVAQILFVALCFALAVKTECELKMPKWFVILSILFYALLPIHIMYSITMWKDITFSGVMILFAVFCLRELAGIGKHGWNLAGLGISSLGITLLRGNGSIALAISLIVFFCVLRFKKKAFIGIILGALLTGCIIKGPVFDALKVAKADILESIAVPIQQVSRVIYEGKAIDVETVDFINKIAPIDEVAGVYNPMCVDNEKRIIKEHNGVEFIVDNKLKCIKKYVSLGLKYPGTYILAWVDETKGVYNGGYPEYRWLTYDWGNDYGISINAMFKPAENILESDYLWLFDNSEFARLLLCEGLYVWLAMISLFVATVKGNKVAALMIVPFGAIVITLIIATPMSASVRYVYSIICAAPLIIAAALQKKSV